MNLTATRQAALLQARVKLITEQRELLSDLGDIKESRRLNEEVGRAVADAAARGLVPADPLSTVTGDWRRLAHWSNRVHELLISLDALCDQTCTLSLESDQKPSAAWLSSWKSKLEAARERLAEQLTAARAELRSDDWITGMPHIEMLQVSTLVAPNDLLKTAIPCESVDLPRQRREILAASWLAVQAESQVAAVFLERIESATKQANEALQLHRKHSESLKAIESLVSRGEMRAAQALLESCPEIFSDLDYEETEDNLEKLIARITSIERESTVWIHEGPDLIQKAYIRKWIPSNSLQRRAELIERSLIELNARLANEKRRYRSGEAYSRLVALERKVEKTLHSVRQEALPVIRRASNRFYSMCIIAAAGLAVGLVLLFYSAQR